MAMSPATQVQLVKDEPGLIGALNGLPSMVRDKANRIVLANDIAADKAKVATLTAEEEQLKAEIAVRGRGHRRVQLYISGIMRMPDRTWRSRGDGPRLYYEAAESHGALSTATVPHTRNSRQTPPPQGWCLVAVAPRH